MEKIIWTKHSEKKISFYNLSKNRVLRVIKNPFRIEEGIAPQTIAVMKPINPKKIKYHNNKRKYSSTKLKWNQEIWVMFQKNKKELKIISAWRYPGISPATNPIPMEIIEELKNEGWL